jgi:hypothetical protein
MTEEDFARYEALANSGLSDEDVCKQAAKEGRDFFYRVRMLRAVFGFDIARARDVAARVDMKEK